MLNMMSQNSKNISYKCAKWCHKTQILFSKINSPNDTRLKIYGSTYIPRMMPNSKLKPPKKESMPDMIPWNQKCLPLNGSSTSDTRH